MSSWTLISDRLGGANMQIIKPEFRSKAFNISGKRSRLTKRAITQSHNRMFSYDRPVNYLRQTCV